MMTENLHIEKQSNQLQTLFVEQPGAQYGSVQMWFRAGSSLEKKGYEGIAHFLEHMFFKGTPLRPGSKIAKDVESFGGEINAFTSFDYTCYYINFPRSKVTESLHILLDMVSHPEFLNKELVSERNVVFEEYLRSKDNPSHCNFHIIQEKCFENSYQHPILGFEKTIRKFSREQLMKFRTQYYNLHNALLIVAGDLKEKKNIKKTISQYKLPSGKQSQFLPFKIKNTPSLSIHEKDVSNIQTTLVIQAPEYENKETSAEDLAINALGYGESSPLYQNLVLKTTLATESSASTMFMVKGGGHFIRVVCPPSNLKKVYEKLIGIFKKVLKEGFSAEDIQKIKNQYISSNIYEKESIESFALSLGHSFAQNGDIYSEKKFIEALKKCSNDDAHQSLLNIFRRTIHLTVQVPQKTLLSETKKHCQWFQKELKKLAQISKNKQANFKKLAIKSSSFDEQTKIITIKEGIHLIHRHNTITPTFNMYAFIGGGLTKENKQNNGLYSLVSRLMIKGYKGKSLEQLNADLDKMSSSLNPMNGRNSYGLSLHGLSEHSEELFDSFFHSLTGPLFSAKNFVHEKKMMKQELLSQEKNPSKQCFQLANEIFFSGHPYSLPTTGSFSSLSSLQRKMLVNCHYQNLKKEQILITVSGDIDFNQALNLITPYIENLPPRAKVKKTKAKGSGGKKFSTIKKYRCHKTMDRAQTQIFIGIRTFSLNHKNDLYLKILTAHLSGQSSELFVNVRDKNGLCYVVQPVHFSAKEGGYWGIYMASSPEKTKQATVAINDILDKYRKSGLTPHEFEMVKVMIQGQNLLNIQTNSDFAHVYSIPFFHGLNLDYHHHTLKAIESSTCEDFNKAIQSILSKKKVKITVGVNDTLDNNMNKA